MNVYVYNLIYLYCRCYASFQEISVKASSWHDKICRSACWHCRMPGSVWPSSQEVLIGSYWKDFDGACLDIKADNNQNMLLILFIR